MSGPAPTTTADNNNPLPLTGVSPSPTTLQDRYSSPPTGGFRRRLFVDPVESEPGATSTSSAGSSSIIVTKTGPPGLIAAIPPGQTVVATATVSASSWQTLPIPVQGEAPTLTGTGGGRPDPDL